MHSSGIRLILVKLITTIPNIKIEDKENRLFVYMPTGEKFVIDVAKLVKYEDKE